MRCDQRSRILRTCDSEERELLMFLGRGLTRHAAKDKLIKDSPEKYEDIRCSHRKFVSCRSRCFVAVTALRSLGSYRPAPYTAGHRLSYVFTRGPMLRSGSVLSIEVRVARARSCGSVLRVRASHRRGRTGSRQPRVQRRTPVGPGLCYDAWCGLPRVGCPSRCGRASSATLLAPALD